MIRSKVDYNYYATAADEPDYGSWFRSSVGKDNTWTFEGDSSSNASKLPKAAKGVPVGSHAVCTDKKVYVLDASDSWSPMVTD